MGSLLFIFWFGCIRKPDITTPPITYSPPVGSVEAREYILLAYVAQYNQDSNASMDAFEHAHRADPSSDIILLLWGDSAWEQGLSEKARWAWKEYEQTLSSDDKKELEQITERLERP